MSEDVVLAGALLTWCRDTPGAIPVATGSSGPILSGRTIAVAPGSCHWRGTMMSGSSAALLGATDEHMVGDLDSTAAASLRICDVIVQRAAAASPAPCPAGAPATPDARLERIFARYPGCAVAAIAASAGDHVVGLRDGRSIRFARLLSTARQATSAGSGEGDGLARRDPGTSTTAVCASLVHVWMASGGRFGALDSAAVVVTVVVAAGPRLEVLLVHAPD